MCETDWVAKFWEAVSALHEQSGLPSLNEVEGCWQIDAGPFSVRVNGHDVEVDKVPPYHAIATRDGFPLAVCGPDGATLVCPHQNFFDAVTALEQLRIELPASAGEGGRASGI